MYTLAVSFSIASLWELVAVTRDNWLDRQNTIVDAHTASGLVLVAFPTFASFAGYVAWNDYWFLLVHGGLVGVGLLAGLVPQFID